MSRSRLASARLVGLAAGDLVDACRGCCTGQALRAVYDAVLDEEVPDAIRSTFDRLGGNAAVINAGGGGR